MRIIGSYFAWVGVGLASVWIAMWAAYVFAGRPTPVAPEAFKLVAALDISIMVTVLGLGGILLWQRKAWGYVVAAIAGIQGSLYLFVLSVNSIVAIRRGLAEAPGELPMWASRTTSIAMSGSRRGCAAGSSLGPSALRRWNASSAERPRSTIGTPAYEARLSRLRSGRTAGAARRRAGGIARTGTRTIRITPSVVEPKKTSMRPPRPGSPLRSDRSRDAPRSSRFPAGACRRL